jgi:hypothetical protein
MGGGAGAHRALAPSSWPLAIRKYFSRAPAPSGVIEPSRPRQSGVEFRTLFYPHLKLSTRVHIYTLWGYRVCAKDLAGERLVGATTMTTLRTNVIENMRPKEAVLRQKIAKAIDFLEKAKAVLNGYAPEAEVAIDDALERLDAAQD